MANKKCAIKIITTHSDNFLKQALTNVYKDQFNKQEITYYSVSSNVKLHGLICKSIKFVSSVKQATLYSEHDARSIMSELYFNHKHMLARGHYIDKDIHKSFVIIDIAQETEETL